MLFKVSKMKKLLLVFVAAVIILETAYASLVFADDTKQRIAGQSEKKQTGEDVTYLYKSCKESLADGTFEKSPCKAAIASAAFSIAFATSALPAYKPEDPCKKAKADLVYEFQNRVCPPSGTDFREVAQKYVEWYENPENHAHSPEFFVSAEGSMVISIFNNYSCTTKLREKKDGLDNPSK